MKVLVTGGAGYIGSHCVKALANAGHRVIVFDNLSSGHNKENTSHIFKGDLRNRDDLNKVFSATSFDAVMHFAAKIEVKESQIDPGKYYENNVGGTINLLETMRAHKVNTFVFSSTAAVYGNPTEIPLKETSPKEPINTYGQTKLIIEKMLEDYHRAYGLSVVVFRYFNAAGAATDGSIGEMHQPESHLIPILLDKLVKGESFTINGNDYDTPDKTAIRDYVHVTDIAQAHVLGLEFAHFEKPFEIFNIGSGEGFSINQVIDTAEKLTGKKLNVEFGPRREGDPARLIADSSKLREKLGWTPEYSSLETILQTAYHWYKKNSSI